MEATARGIQRRTVFSVDDCLRSRFASRVLKQGDHECWPWLGAVRNGYGAIKHKNGLLSTHVVAWVIAVGRNVQPGKLICHTCDDRLCCNPAHLYEGTPADNIHDMDHRRRLPRLRGTQVYNSVLNDAVAQLILSLAIVHHWGGWRIAKVLGRNKRTIEKVIRRETWKHIPIPSQQEAAAIVYDWRQSQ